MISFQHCDSGVPITVTRDPVTGGWDARVDDFSDRLGFSDDALRDAHAECIQIARRLNDWYADQPSAAYWDEGKAAQCIRKEFHHEAEVI